jgi:hypothetical protein
MGKIIVNIYRSIFHTKLCFFWVVANQLGIPWLVVDSYPEVDMLLKARPNISLPWYMW